jgi:hypothetical protein
MGIAHKRKIFELAMPALLLSSLLVGDCTPASAGSSLMDARAQAARPKKSIFDPPPQREPAMTLDERQKMQKELNAARDRQTQKPKLTQCRPLNRPSLRRCEPAFVRPTVRRRRSVRKRNRQRIDALTRRLGR